MKQIVDALYSNKMKTQTKKIMKPKSKEKILTYLRLQKEGVPLTKIAMITGVNYYQTQDDLEELLGENKIEQHIFRGRIYWRIKK